MFKNVLYILSALLASSAVMAQCTNNACTVANAIYKECKLTTTTTAAFQKCLCTDKFLVNYKRCVGGTVCAWDGNPATLNSPCITLYCPGTFVGGFDAIAFCAGRLPLTTTKTTKVITPTLTWGPIPIETGIA